jgi:hypothetical protein
MSLKTRLIKLEANQTAKTKQDENHVSHESTKQWLNDIIQQMHNNNGARLQNEPNDL